MIIRGSVTRATLIASASAILAAVIVWAAPSVSPPPAPPPTIPPKIVAHYADDAVVINPGSPAVNGKEAAKAALEDFVGDPAFSLTLSPAEIETAKSGDVAYAHGACHLAMTNPVTKKPLADKGTYLEVYRKQADGTWKIAADMASSEEYWAIPPAPPAN